MEVDQTPPEYHEEAYEASEEELVMWGLTAATRIVNVVVSEEWL